VYVYGVVAAEHSGAVAATGVEGCAVHPVECEGLSAIVSDVQGDALAVAREVRAHWRVLEAAADKATVLPIRFGTVMESEHAVCEQLLAPNAEGLRRLLGELDGHVQLSVKGEYDEDALMRAVVLASPAIGALRERVRTLPDAAGYYDRIRLGELVAQDVARRRDDDAAAAMARLQPCATAARAESPSSAGQAFNLAFLVRRERLDAFSAAVRALGAQLGDRVAIRYVGPLPPYSFVDAELTAGSAAWA
jgi:hypothetical protein